MMMISHSVVSDSWRSNGPTHAMLSDLLLSFSAVQCLSLSLLMISSQRVFWGPLVLFPLCQASFNVLVKLFASHGRKKVRCSFVILPSSDISGLIRFRTSLLETLSVHGILKSLLQHHNSKASILLRSVFFFTVQLSHPYIDIGNTIVWTSLHLVVRLRSLLFQICCMLSIALRPSDIRCFISGVQSPVWSIIDPKKQNSLTHSISSPLIVTYVRDQGYGAVVTTIPCITFLWYWYKNWPNNNLQILSSTDKHLIL